MSISLSKDLHYNSFASNGNWSDFIATARRQVRHKFSFQMSSVIHLSNESLILRIFFSRKVNDTETLPIFGKPSDLWNDSPKITEERSVTTVNFNQVFRRYPFWGAQAHDQSMKQKPSYYTGGYQLLEENGVKYGRSEDRDETRLGNECKGNMAANRGSSYDHNQNRLCADVIQRSSLFEWGISWIVNAKII